MPDEAAQDDPSPPTDDAGIGFVDAGSATAHLHAALRAAIDRFPDDFADIAFPDDPAAFKSAYPDALPSFEAARASSPNRTEIARTVVAAADERMVMHPHGVRLSEALSQPAEPFTTDTHQFAGGSRLHPRVPLDGDELGGQALVDAVAEMAARGSASRQVVDSIEWLIGRAGAEGIDLTGRRIAMLGAGAELAPTRMWLEGGADVLWLDVADPPAELLARDDLSGSLHWVPGGIDVLTQPGRVRATIESFAADAQVDLGLYAYAGGQAREWRLAAAMNAIVDALPASSVHGVAMLLSPTTCGVLTEEDLAGEEARRNDATRWLRTLDRVRLLGRGGGHVTVGARAANRGVVSIQGGSYQGAQYVGKMLAAEVWATADPKINVSVNTAGVSLTGSLQHPVFDIAFAGAEAMDVETFAPATTAALNGLLTLRDRIDPAAGDRTIDELFTTRVHGGIYVAPYPINEALRVAAGIGLLKDPRRVGALVRR